MHLPFQQPALQSITEDRYHLKRIVDNVAYGLHGVTRTIVERDSSSDSSSSSSSTCKPGNNSPQCITPASVQNTQNIAIILGVVIPLGCAIAVLVFLHRRLRKKQRLEDVNDPHKSLDFGMPGVDHMAMTGSKKSRKGPEMSVGAISGHGRSSRRGGQLSADLDMNIGSPYMLPPGLHGSHESIHSLSRAMPDAHDPYRPVTFIRPSMDSASLRSGRMPDDKGSVYSVSTAHHSVLPQDKAGLLANARPMSQTFSKRTDLRSLQDTAPAEEFPLRQLHSANPSSTLPKREASLEKDLPPIIQRRPLPSPPTIPEPVAKELPPPPPRTSSAATSSATGSSIPPREDSMLTSSATTVPSRPESSNYGDDYPRASAQPTISVVEPRDSQYDTQYDVDPSAIYARWESDEHVALQQLPNENLSTPVTQAGSRLSMVGVRPLPPDLPEDNPEVRANRIRSFYKEYFDENRPNPPPGHYDFYDDVLDGVIYDPDSGGFLTPGNKPWAQGPARRAMTPPPRGPPRGSGGPAGYPHQRQFSAYSTMSGGRPRGRSMPKKHLPPPKPLHSLPTPGKLREDDLVFSPIDFAPPTTFRDQQMGRRADSPLGTPRPYSPSVRPFTPLASSFDHLAALPSPHDLRKSGTFTALDFAPPSKIRDGGLSPNDGGSIRSGFSGRSGISAIQHHALRDGAYRVSRIPREMVTTKDDLANQLKPRLNMVAPA